MSSLATEDDTIATIKRKIDEIKDFLSISLSVANAHTVDFYTRDVWDEFIGVPAYNVLSIISTSNSQKRAPAGRGKAMYGFCADTGRLVDVSAFLEAARAHSLPELGVCTPLGELLRVLQVRGQPHRSEKDVTVGPDEFMNSKKSHEVQILSEVVASLAKSCGIQQVIDLGSGKGYLCSFLSMQYGLKVFGIDSSSTNTHGAQERNRKLKKYSKSYRRQTQEPGERTQEPGERTQEPGERTQEPGERTQEPGERTQDPGKRTQDPGKTKQDKAYQREGRPRPLGNGNPPRDPSDCAARPGEHGLGEVPDVSNVPEPWGPFLGVLSPEAVEPPSPRVPPSELSREERERRKRENLERKARGRSDDSLYSPLTSYVTAETELRDIVTELEDAVMVGLHTCGDLAPSTLRMFVAKQELRATCSVGCCYHLLSEEFDGTRQECSSGVWGFPMSQYLRDTAWFCGRNARMSACLALDRVAVGQGLPTESLFYRAVLHVILRDHYGAVKSEKRVGKVYSKATSFVDYARRALRKLELDEFKLADSLIQSYHDKYRPRMEEMEAFNMLKVSLAPCIEGLILLDRLCYLKEQENISTCWLVQLFDPLMSPRCYGVIGLKKLNPA